MSENAEKLILVVDDEPLMVTLVEKILVEEGYKVITAGDGVYAMSLVREYNPDLILMDIRMPGPDGILTLQRLRDISKVPVIMVTGMGGEELVEQSIDSGADDFIRKPFKPKELVARVKAKLRRV
jgi:DNA-binding response OmpR family regulator